MSFARRLAVALAWAFILLLLLVLAIAIIDFQVSVNEIEWAARKVSFRQELEWPPK